MYDYNKEYLTYIGKPILPIMGEFHFSRYPKEEWRSALEHIKKGGVDIVASYIFWIHHEEGRGEWDFTGRRSLRDFLSLCRDVGLKVWLRIGPWAHGECRNGGFPDWLVQMEKGGLLTTRTNHPAYLALVEEFFARIGQEAAGFLYAEGGPIIGIQIENEYGHAGGPSDREEGMSHMKELKRLAEKRGLTAPYFSATGWGGAYVPEGFLAVLGGYVDAPWADHIHELEASDNFLFQPFHNDSNIGSDLADRAAAFTFDPARVPYLTAELGGGLQVTAHRRTYPYPEDIEAQTICMLGSGANLIGYYMYHGGINPEGKYSTLQESKATGYNNDLPVKSYDFQTCLRENGLPSETYFRLRKHHIFVQSVQELLAPAKVYLPSNYPKPAGPEDMETPRASFRYNHEADCGFLFINNHQRKRRMTEKCFTEDHPLCFQVGENPEIVFDRVLVREDAILVLPYNLPIRVGEETIRLHRTNASYLGNFGGKDYFYTDEKAQDVYFEWSDKKDHREQIRLLTRPEAEHFDGLADGGRQLIFIPPLQWKKAGEAKVCQKEGAGGEYLISLCYDWEACAHRPGRENGEDVFLELEFGGDKAQLYQDGRLIADWFSNGEVWRLALRRYGYPEKLTLKLYPFDEKVYYDLTPRKEMCLMSARLKTLSVS